MNSPEFDRELFLRLRSEVECQISEYVYDVPAGAVGVPIAAEQIRDYLQAMRDCLIEPRWEAVHICNTPEEIWTGVGKTRKCVIMAEDGGYVLVFDALNNEYQLAWRGEHGLGTWGVRGDAVGCFIAR